MRFLLLWCALSANVFAAVPAELAAALATFRAEVPRGWSFTQTTEGEGKSTVERCDATKPEFAQWTLVSKDGHAPTIDDAKHYADIRSRRSRGGTAPKITEQFDLSSVEKIAEAEDRVTFRCRLKPSEASDKMAAFLIGTVIVHRATQSIESITLASIDAFSPTLGVQIANMVTTMTYTPPTASRPTLPEKVATHLRGRAFFFKSLDAEMTVIYSDYQKVRK